MSKKPVVFISSTARDLPEYRSRVQDACLRSDMFPKMMERLPASEADAKNASLAMVDEAEVYVGIFAHRYGYIPKGEEISISHMEYNRAKERGIPCLIFIMSDDMPVKPRDFDTGEQGHKLQELKKELLKSRVVAFFKSPDNLRGLVIQALMEVKKLLDANSPEEKVASKEEVDPKKRKILRVFVASPSDVHEERSKMPKIIESLNKTLGPLANVVIELWRWEVNAPPAAGEPQALIDPELDKADVVLVIFWNRFGMPTTAGTTGTEGEVLRSLQRWKQVGRPQVMIYYCQRPATLNIDEMKQRIQVLAFKDRISSLALTAEYNDIPEFEWRVRDDLFLVLANL